MADFYFTESGDIALAANGDIGETDTDWRDDAQQAYVRIKTDPGDWTIWPSLGADMTRLFGMPQSPQTGELGKQIIIAALQRENRFAGKGLEINAVPTGPQTIRFDIYITNGTRDSLILSIEQDLGVSS